MLTGSEKQKVQHCMQGHMGKQPSQPGGRGGERRMQPRAFIEEWARQARYDESV